MSADMVLNEISSCMDEATRDALTLALFAETFAHNSMQRNALGTFVNCDGPMCTATFRALERDGAGRTPHGID